MTKVACLGECMIELREMADGRFARSYGGDTLNTAIYLARLGVAVDYVTALGDDPWSDEMIAGWAAEGVGTEQVARVPGRVPGLYIIQTDARGERSFLYWRDSAPARALFDSPETSDIVDILPSYDLLYFSGITLSLYGDTGRARFFDVLHRAGQQGRRIAFDTNFRPRGWPDRALAQTAYRAAFDRADIILASTEDLELLFGAGGLQELLSHRSSTELVLKLATPACRVISADHDEEVHSEPVADVVDTTAAGDSFAAAYIAARLSGAVPREAAYTGHRLAGAVVRHPGAIIPSAAMPSGIIGTTRPQQGDARMTSATAAAASRTDRLKELLGLAPVIPVITIERVEDAVPLARALVSGGLRLLEITLRTRRGGTPPRPLSPRCLMPWWASAPC